MSLSASTESSLRVLCRAEVDRLPIPRTSHQSCQSEYRRFVKGKGYYHPSKASGLEDSTKPMVLGFAACSRAYELP